MIQKLKTMQDHNSETDALKLFIGKRCAIYKPLSEGGTVFAVCLSVSEHDITFDTGGGGPMTIPRGKYTIRADKTREGEDHARPKYTNASA